MQYKIPFYRTWFPKGSRRYAHEALDSGWVAQGPYIQKATNKLKELFGYKHVLLTSSGTAALNLSGLAAFIFRATKESYYPTNCYVAAHNAVFTWLGLSPNHRQKTYPLDHQTWNGHFPVTVESPNRDGATVVVVHNLGNPVDVPNLRKEYRKPFIIEDCCEALGAKYGDRRWPFRFVGSEADCAAFSFYGTKAVTSGEGGAFVTSNPNIYRVAKLAAAQGQGDEPYQHITTGSNFRMSNLQAALLFGQLSSWQEILERKEDLFGYYQNHLMEYVEVQMIKPYMQHSNWCFGAWIPDQGNYRQAKEYFDSVGIETRPFFYPLNYHNHLRDMEIREQEWADSFSDHIVLFPCYPQLIHEEKENLDYIIEQVKEYAITCQ